MNKNLNEVFFLKGLSFHNGSADTLVMMSRTEVHTHSIFYVRSMKESLVAFIYFCDLP